ncbi:MAG: CYTH domain-containing protein [Steroidobacteraceae bacterium]
MPLKPPAPLEQHTREIEWQLAAADLAPVQTWLVANPAVGGFRIEPLPGERLRDTYLDTDDWRVFRSGYALRLRRGHSHAEATLKSLRSARTDLADRQEITETLADGQNALEQMPGPVGRWLRGVLDREPLAPLFTACTQRERFAVYAAAPGAAVGEISLDETHLLATSQAPRERLLRVEVELRDGHPEALAPLVEALRQACRLAPARENKFAAGLRAAALVPPLSARRPTPRRTART